MADAIIVGGGIAGLGCAWRLQQEGLSVQVLESNAQAGGRMRSERHGDTVVDRGAQFIASGYQNIQHVASELGLDQEIESVRETSNAILRDGRLLAGDYESPLAFLRSPLLSLRSKWRLRTVARDLWRHRDLLDPMHPEKAAELDIEDMASYLERVAGEEALEYLFGPAFSSTFDSDPENLSALFALLGLRFLANGFRIQSFVGGTGRLTQELAEKLPVHLSCHVTSVEPHDTGVHIDYEQNGTVERKEAKHAVLAVPGTQVAALCPRLSEAERSFFDEVHYVRGIIVFLLLDEAPATLPHYGVAFPRSEGLDLYGLAVDHHKPGVVPEGAGLLNAALTESAAERMWQAPDEEIAALVIDNLARTPIGRLAPHTTLVHRWDPMLPQFRAGYVQKLAAFHSRTDPTRRLGFAGDYLVGPYTEAALSSGLRAAGEILVHET